MKHRLQMHTFIVSLIMLAASSCTMLDLRKDSRTGGWIDWDEDPGGIALPALESTGSAFRGDSLPASTMEEASPVVEGFAGEEPAEDEDIQQAGNLRAGSVDDNQQWDDYLLYRLRFAEWGYEFHDIDVVERVEFQVSSPDGSPILGAEITIVDSSGKTTALLRTHSDGKTLFFPAEFLPENSQSYTASVSKNGQSISREISRSSRFEEFILDTNEAEGSVRLDIQFLIDVTGSMADEIQQLKSNMIRISSEIENLPSNPEVRFAMTVYRDRGDEFVSRSFDFTPDVEYFTSELSKVTADGGGDYPESLNEAFHKALTLPEWRVEDTVSLLFVVADAPPHLDYPQDNNYAEDIFTANEMGIKVFPVGSSGLDDQGEYILRQMAQISAGKFLFLTYGADGAPGDETTHHVDDYSVLSLDELVIQIVTEELAALDLQQP